jgi:uncharacterized protein with PQ loop repeat
VTWETVMSLAATVGAVGMFVGVAGFAWLLLLRVVRAGSVAGLSMTTVSISWAASFMWGSYALLSGDVVNLVVSGAALAATTALIALILFKHRKGAAMLRPLSVVLLLSFGFLAAAVISSTYGLLALAGSGTAIVMLWPQAYKAVRDADLSGVSPSAFAVRASFAGVGWLAHTVATGDVWFLVQFAFAVPPALIVAYKAYAFHRSVAPAARLPLATARLEPAARV